MTTTTITFKIDDKVKHRNERVSWKEGVIVGTPATDPWMCAPGMVMVAKNGIESTIPIALLEPIEEDF